MKARDSQYKNMILFLGVTAIYHIPCSANYRLLIGVTIKLSNRQNGVRHA
jgi:hypothetical protein